MPREVKELMLQELKEKFHDIKETGCVLVAYQGVKADQAWRARRDLRQKGGEMTVVKNSLFALAVEHLGVGELRALLDGPIAVIRAANPVEAARAAEEMSRTCQAVRVRGAYVDGSVLDARGTRRLATIPSREVLLSMLAGQLLAPLRRLAFGLLDRPRALVGALDQLKERAAPGSPQQEQTEQ